MRLDKALAAGLVQYFDAKPAYLVRVAELIDVQPIKDAGLKVVVDNMWGNGAGWLSEILGGGKTEIIEVHAERNPSFPEMSRPEPIPPNVDAGLAVGKKVGADCVCIMDGDADRCGFGDEHGEFIDQLRVYGLLAYYLLEIRGQRGTIVKTLSTTSMLDKLGKLYGVPVVNTGVGFKYRGPGHDGTRRHDRRRRERRLRLPRPRARAGRHHRQPLSAGPDGAHGQDAHPTAHGSF